MQSIIEHPPGSSITIRQVSNLTTTSDGARKSFGVSFLVVVPAKRRHGRGRERRQFDNLDGAKDWAEQQDKGLRKLAEAFVDLDGPDRAQAASAFHMVRNAKVCPTEEAGSYLTTLVADAIAAVQILGTAGKLAEAAGFYQARKGSVKAIPVLDAIEQLLLEKKQDDISVAHYNDLSLRLRHFASKFGLASVSDLDAQQIDGWLRSLDVGKRSRVNYRRVVLTFLRFCERRGWLARGAIEGASISRPKVKSTGPIEIFRPEELGLLLEQSSDKLRPYFVLGGLCGLRTAESLRLDWSEIDFKRNTITIEAAKSKTASRRLVPLCPAAKEWLLPLRKKSGRVLPYYHVAKEVVRFLNRLNFGKAGNKLVWKSNGLRHTYVSARLAILKDAAKVAMECGNSPAMIFSNYRELMHEETALEWFALAPAKEAGAIIKFQPAVA